MEASLKFRENQDPILKSKIPLKVLTFPFRSSIEASTDSTELCLSFSSFWGSGPRLKLNYRPNDPGRPFGLVLKTGIGSLGSPVGAPFTISVEYNFPVNSNHSSSRNPSFYVNFNPRIGDFAIRRRVIPEIQHPSRSSPDFLLPVVNNQNGSSVLEKSDEASEKTRWTKLISGGFAAAEGLIGKEEVCARTVMPVMDWAAVKLRWGLRFPAAAADEGRREKMPMPFLVLNKIGIEQMERAKLGRERDSRGNGSGCSGDDVAEAGVDLKKELNVLRRENELMKKDLEDFKSEICGWKFEKNCTSTKRE